MKKAKKFLSVFLATVILSLPIAAMAAAAPTIKDYVISNPYKAVNWDTWGAYKFQPHCHTTASDGYLTVKEVVQGSYDRDYDVVAITDHGTLNKGWNTVPDLVPIIRVVKYERTKLSDIVPLTDEEYKTYLNGTASTTTGLVRTNGMLDVPLGIELNMATPVCDCHLTGYFSEYGQGFAGVYGDYETPSAGVKDAGGISMLSHVGEYVYPDKDSADHVGQKVDDYYANKFARLFIDNAGSSVGMGINSATDAHTRCDRILYDQILQKTIPNGVIPWGFCFSDSHNEESLNDAYTMLMMKDLNLDNVRSAMVNGQSFAVSHFSNGVELNGMEEIPGYVEEKVNAASNDTPMVTRVTVDNKADTISIEGINFNSITWVSNCNVIKRETGIKNGKATLTLNASDLLDTPELYVRFYITGKDGICYSQPFTILEKGTTVDGVYVPETNDTSTALRSLVTILDELFFQNSVIVRLFKYFALGY